MWVVRHCERAPGRRAPRQRARRGGRRRRRRPPGRRGLAALVFLPLLARRRAPLLVLLAVLAAGFDRLRRRWTTRRASSRRGSPSTSRSTAPPRTCRSGPRSRLARSSRPVAVAIEARAARRDQRGGPGRRVPLPRRRVGAGALGAPAPRPHREPGGARGAARGRPRRARPRRRRRGAAVMSPGRLHEPVVSHAVSVMVIQAGAARQVLRTSPNEAEGAMLGPSRRPVARRWNGLRRFLGALSDDQEAAGLAPQPGIVRTLPALLDRVREAGLPAPALEVAGTARTVPPSVDLSVYRIVQEGLTNALRHAHARRTPRAPQLNGRSVELEVLDDGSGPIATNGTGLGLVGMRERVSLSAASSRPAPVRVAGSCSAPGCRWTGPRRDPRRGRRRPGPRPGRVPPHPRGPAGHRGRRRGG